MRIERKRECSSGTDATGTRARGQAFSRASRTDERERVSFFSFLFSLQQRLLLAPLEKNKKAKKCPGKSGRIRRLLARFFFESTPEQSKNDNAHDRSPGWIKLRPEKPAGDERAIDDEEDHDAADDNVDGIVGDAATGATAAPVALPGRSARWKASISLS